MAHDLADISYTKEMNAVQMVKFTVLWEQTQT